MNQAAVPPVVDKKQATEAMREYHKQVFDAQNINRLDFYPKMSFQMGDRKVIGMYASEMEKATFFTEIIDRDWVPVGPARKLLQFTPKPNYKAVYTSIGTDKYAIPIEDLNEVNFLMATMTKSTQAPPPMDLDKIDENFSKMTIRDLAAILKWKPVSNKGWINQMIIQEPKSI